MKFVVVCSGPIFAHPNEWVEKVYLSWYNPDYNKGEGQCHFTCDVKEAMLFDTLERAVAYVERVPVNNPMTESGVINRPISCFTISYQAIDIDDAKKGIVIMPASSGPVPSGFAGPVPTPGWRFNRLTTHGRRVDKGDDLR